MTVVVIGDDAALLRAFIGGPETQARLQTIAEGRSRLLRAILPDAGASIREAHDEYNSAPTSLPLEDLRRDWAKECPDIAKIPLVQVLRNTAAAARRGHRGWDAVRAGAGLPPPASVPTRKSPAVGAISVRTVRRTPSSGRPARQSVRRKLSAASRGSPRSEDDEPAPPRAASTRICAGCGEEFIPRRPNQRYCPERSNACRQRAYYRRQRTGPTGALERYLDEVWEARRSGVIDGVEALELLIAPRPRVLAMLAEAVAA